MNLSFRQLSYLVAAAQHASIADAAKALSISPSSVLMAIDKFEAEYNIQLFVRRRAHGLLLTCEGERALKHIRHLIEEMEELDREIRYDNKQLRGELRIGSFTSLSPHLLPQVVANMNVKHPGLTISVLEGDILAIQQMLRDGIVDALLTYDAALWDDFENVPLIDAPPYVVMAKDDLLAMQEIVDLGALNDRVVLLLSQPQSSIYFRSLLDAGKVTPQRVIRVATFEMVRSCAAAGLGLAILNIRPPSDMTYCGLEVACRPLHGAGASPTIIFAKRRNGNTPPAVEAFLAACQSYFESDEPQKFFVPASSEK